MKKQKPIPRKRNPIAARLHDGSLRAKIIPNKKRKTSSKVRLREVSPERLPVAA